MGTCGLEREFCCWIKLSKRVSARDERRGRGRNLGNMGRACWCVARAALSHLKKIIQILGRIAQCKCSFKSYTLNNVGGIGKWTVPVSSKVRDDGGFLSHSTFGLFLIFKSVNTCHFCYSGLLRLWVKIMEGHLTFSYVQCHRKDLRSTMHSLFQMLNRFMCVECETSCS